MTPDTDTTVKICTGYNLGLLAAAGLWLTYTLVTLTIIRTADTEML